MQRITTPTRAVDLFGPGKDGFTEGDPATGILATRLNADWFNGTQEEIVHVIEQAGISLAGGDRTQLYQAIQALIAAGSTTVEPATETRQGIVELATGAETAGLADPTRAVTPASLGAALPRSLAESGYQRMLGGLVMQWGRTTVSTDAAGGAAIITFPMAFPMVCAFVIGSWRQSIDVDSSWAVYANPISNTQAKIVYDAPPGAPAGNKDTSWFALGY